MNIKLDLEEKCVMCFGTGNKYKNRYADAWESDKNIIPGVCGDCDGHGYVLTELGYNLVKMLERRYGLKFQQGIPKYEVPEG